MHLLAIVEEVHWRETVGERVVLEPPDGIQAHMQLINHAEVGRDAGAFSKR